MKIAIVLNTSWNVYNFRMGLLKALMDEGHDICVMAPRDAYSDELTAAGFEFHNLRMDSRGANPFKDFALIAELTAKYREVRPDVVLHYTIKPNIYGSIAASLCKVPAINNVSGLGTVFLKKSVLTHLAKGMYRIAFRHPFHVFFQNEEDKQLFLSAGLVKEARTGLVPGSGIDTEYFSPTKHITNKEFTFLVIARLIYDKGIEEYVKAAREIKTQGIKVRFQLLGAKDPKHKRGIPSELVDSWVADGIIDYLGTTDDVRSFISHADCIVLPSYREGTPRTLLEAASCGKPIITTDVPGCRNVVEDGKNGLLCKVQSSRDLISKMHMMMDLTPEKRERMGRYGRDKIKCEFSESRVINEYKKTINQLDQKRPNTHGN